MSLHHLRTTVYGLPLNVARAINTEALALIYGRSRKYSKQILRIIYDTLDRRLFPPQEQNDAVDGPHRKFLTLLFHNKGLDYINLPRILNNRAVTHAIPEYFVCQEPPCLGYRYTGTIAKEVFNHKQTCADFQKDQGINGFVCACNNKPEFIHPKIGHILTGNLNIVNNQQLREILKRGPKYRQQNHIQWSLNRKLILEAVDVYINKWAKDEDVDPRCLYDYKDQIMVLVDHKIDRLKKTVKIHRPQVLSQTNVRNELDTLHNTYVMVPADKAANNIIFICKKWYIEQIIQELHISDNDPEDSSYKGVDLNIEELVKDLTNFCGLMGLKNTNKRVQLPTLYGLPKMHKATPKLRYIAASCASPLKPMDLTVTKCLTVIYKFMQNYCKSIYNYTGTNRMWILDNSLQLKSKLAECNELQYAKCISTWDFSTLYTTIPHQLLKDNICDLINFSFKKTKKAYIATSHYRSFWSNREIKNYKCIDSNTLIDHINFLINSIYVTFGDTLHQQIIGIPMGISCAPLLANLFLMTYEYKFMERLEKDNIHKARKFNFTSRYIDDLISLNNEDFHEHMSDIYPKELCVKQENTSPTSASYLDLQIDIENQPFHTKLYDKRDSFNFSIVNFPFVEESNITEGVQAPGIWGFNCLFSNF